MKPAPGLAQQYRLWLALAFIGLELLAVLAFVWWVMLPMARRSADDLAGLMVLSALVPMLYFRKRGWLK